MPLRVYGDLGAVIVPAIVAYRAAGSEVARARSLPLAVHAAGGPNRDGSALARSRDLRYLTSMRRGIVWLMVAVSSDLACASTDHGAGAVDGDTPSGDAAGAGEASLDSGLAADGEHPSQNDASTPSDGTTPACSLPLDDAGTCFEFQPLGTLVTSTCSSAEPPQVEGGSIANGMYVLDSLVFLGGCPSATETLSATWAICAQNWVSAAAVVLSADAAPEPSQNVAYVVTSEGTSVSFGPSCGVVIPASDMPARGYTASATGLMFVYPNRSVNGGTIVSHYTLL